MQRKPLSTLLGVPPSGFDPNHTFTTSWLLPPLLLSILRLLIFTYCLATQLTHWIYDGVHSSRFLIGQEFSYFTVLTFWGILFYMLVAGVHTLVYAIKGRSWLDRWPRWLQALHSFYYTTIVTFPILVTIVYWAILYDGPWFPLTFNAWSNISRHALNTFFCLLEIFLPATNPPPFLHVVGLIVLLLLYLGLAYLTHATQGFYVYNFLDPDTGAGKVTGYCFGIFAAILIIFFVVWGLIWVRRRLARQGKRSRRDVHRHVSTDGDVELSGRVSQVK
ncbi:uncharacterized protein A1O9_08698 [Exophiala aquamarina CBS 119918]|uniref:FAR-17a/AIG1-like protein n=1 Tax=Exophiala aquamarina CBS 119918 TaxID=1182545 RepID=A0A072PHM0_9EURO|nr:uncharacterized protein A1O9_08698 [Exophiala aquamarina CBS 119918]KEF55045.1 hypothetical protein A1O9_08698 [Exophiala aquamarina CBS 119918]